MNHHIINRHFICIDLKSFYASCECIERGLDPFTTPLVVADPERKNGAITLAVTPYLKSIGVKSRSRIYEIPKYIKYITAPPRMSLYVKKSKEVRNVYLKYISIDDMYIYSIDEVFIDVTNYLNLYKITDIELAKKILDDIKKTTGLTATCGIGPNMILAKVADDIEAKNNADFIAKWTYDDIETKLWGLSPVSKMWGIGKSTQKKLEEMKIFSIKDLALTNKDALKKKFGIMGEEIWNHANGIDNTLISDLKLNEEDKSYSHSQVLYKDYFEENITLIIFEMCELLASRLRQNKKMTSLVSFGIWYSKIIGGGFSHAQKISSKTDSSKVINEICISIFDKHYNGSPIRKVNIALGKLSDKDSIQLNLFEKAENTFKNEKYNETVDIIRNKFGVNSLINASNLLSDATLVKRNKRNNEK